MSASENDRDRVVARDGEAFYSRWSRRKQDEDRQQDRTPAADPEVEPTPAAPPLSDRDMPAIESLDAESDYKGFLSPEVSDQLRRLALRKLFHTASFNIRDGLDDYDEDFTQFAKLGGLITADIRHQLERAAGPDGDQTPDRENEDSLQPQPDRAAEDDVYASTDKPSDAELEPEPMDPEQKTSEQARS